MNVAKPRNDGQLSVRFLPARRRVLKTVTGRVLQRGRRRRRAGMLRKAVGRGLVARHTATLASYFSEES